MYLTNKLYKVHFMTSISANLSPTDGPSDIIDDTEEKDYNKTPSFPDLEASIKESIQSLGGRVFPKLNWSSPRVSKIHWLCLRALDSTSGPNFIELLKQKLLPNNCLLSRNEQDSSYKLYMVVWLITLFL